MTDKILDNSGLAKVWSLLKQLVADNKPFQDPVDPNYFLAGPSSPSSAADTPSFRSLVLDDLPDIDISSNKITGVLPISKGGTGLTSSPSMLINLASTSAANLLQASPRPGITGVLGLANGGTGQTTAAAAQRALLLSTTTGGQNCFAYDNGSTLYIFMPICKPRFSSCTATGSATFAFRGAGSYKSVSSRTAANSFSAYTLYNGQAILQLTATSGLRSAAGLSTNQFYYCYIGSGFTFTYSA